jgi:hypothetical protein
MRPGSLLQARAIDGRELDAETLYRSEFDAPKPHPRTRFVVLFGDAGVGKTPLVHWIAARIARASLEPGDGAPVPLLLDLERLDGSFLRGSVSGADYDDSLLPFLGEAALGAWVRSMLGFGTRVMSLLDHLEVLEARALRDVVASSARGGGTVVFVCSTALWRRELRQVLEEWTIFGASLDVAAYEVLGITGHRS